MNKLCKSLVSVLLAMVFLSADRLFAQSGIFDRTGIVPGHGAYSSLPEESVDLFTGNLTLAYRDIFLPVSESLNIEVWRVYNSKILQDRPIEPAESHRPGLSQVDGRHRLVHAHGCRP